MMTVPSRHRAAATTARYRPGPYLAVDPAASSLTSRRMREKTTQETMQATVLTTKASAVTRVARMLSAVLVEPRLRRKARKATPVPTGCRTKTLVSALVVSSRALLKSAKLFCSRTLAGL